MSEGRPAALMHGLDDALVEGPAGGTRFGSDLTLHHDCPRRDMTLHQHDGSPLPHAVTLQVRGFEGTYLSFAFGLPHDIQTDLARTHILWLATRTRIARDTTLVARLNIRHGPNITQIVEELVDGRTAFDLAYHPFDVEQLKEVWVDLFFPDPDDNRLTLFDLQVTRTLRVPL